MAKKTNAAPPGQYIGRNIAKQEKSHIHPPCLRCKSHTIETIVNGEKIIHCPKCEPLEDKDDKKKA